jgi:hypothetical protein
MMFGRILRGALVVACTSTAGIAFADIYTWTDAAGMVNVSNIAPPEGVKISKITQDSPPRPAPAIDPAADAARQAEVQALAARVRQLEYEAQYSARQMPTPADYAAVAPPFPMQQPYPMQYVDGPPQVAASDCDPTWAQCGGGGWWGAPFFPATVIVVRAPGFRRPPPFHNGHRSPMQMPVRAPGGMRRG